MGERKEFRRYRSGKKQAKTCPASRHTAMIAESLRDKKSPVHKLLAEAGYEPEHWAGSIESTVVSLWDARQHLRWEELPPTKRYPMCNGHWVPDHLPARDGSAR